MTTDPDAEFRQLVGEIARALRETGFVSVDAADLTVSTALWRRAARAAARHVELPVRTGRSGGQPDLTRRAPHEPEPGWSVWARASEPKRPAPAPGTPAVPVRDLSRAARPYPPARAVAPGKVAGAPVAPGRQQPPTRVTRSRAASVRHQGLEPRTR